MTFGPGSVGGITNRSVFMQIIGDTIGEGNETFFLYVMPAMPEYDDGLTMMFTILDDDRKFSKGFSLQISKLL